MTDRDIIIQKANSYCEATGMALSTLGRVIVNDGKFFIRVINGGDFSTKTKEKLMLWFKENKPKQKDG